MNLLLNEISLYIFENVIRAMQPKSRIVIDGFDISLAKLVSREVNRLVDSDPELDPEEFAIRCLSVFPEDLSSEANIEQAVEFRNGNRKLLLFSDDNSAGSLKDFDNRELGQVIADIEESMLASHAGEFSSKIRAVFSNCENSVSSKQRLEFLISANAPGATLGLNLWRVGLIPDAGEKDFHIRLAANKRAASAISGRVRPLSSVSERLTSAAVVEPVFRNFLHSHLVTLPQSFEVWLESIASGQLSDLTFDLWKISDAPSVEIEKIEIDPFRAKDGSAERACKLVYHSLSHELVYRTQVTVSWRATPSNLESVTDWRVEVLPMGIDDPTPIYSKNVAYGKRTTLTIKGLGEDEATREFDRYFVRVTAISGSEILVTSAGDEASADSDDFILDPDAAEVGTSGTKNLDEWIPEGIIRAQVERGVSNIELGASIFDTKNQVLVTPLGLSHKIMTPNPQIFSELENFVMKVNSSAQSFSLISRHGGAQSFTDITMENIDVSREFASARTKFFSALAQSEGNRTSVSITSWNKPLRKALQIYMEEFIRELHINPNVEELLRLDTLKISVDSSKGKIHGLVLLPFHPLRACWIAEHHSLLMAWVEKINGLDAKQRKLQVDVSLIQKISPINVPEYLVLDSSTTVSPCIYSGELGAGAALYLPSDELNSGEAIQIFRRVLGLKTAGPTGDVSSKAFAKYLTSYVDGRFVEPGLRVCAVNAGDGSVLAAAIETFEKGRQIDLAPLKWNINAYSRVKSFSNTLPALVALNSKKMKFELEAADVRVAHILDNRRSTLLSPSIRVSERQISDLLNPGIPHNISSIQDLANMEIASFADRPERDPILGGLLRPTLNTVVTSDSQQFVFASPARPSADLSELPALTSATESFLAAVSKLLMGNDKPVAVRLQLSAETLGQLNALHAWSDWVVTVDRHLGANLYEQELQSAVGGTYVLDYTPDFIDGFGERVTLTTTKKLEMESVIRSAMERLGLVDSGVTASNILDSLSKVSGRLALQLLKDDNRALESMGLAVVITYLRNKNQLSNTVIIPVDSHHDIFGIDANTVSDSSERCDLLLIRFEDDGAYALEFVEVKARTGLVPPNLASHMSKQTERTWNQLKDLLFDRKNTRIDRELQWSRWNSLLHFYLERASNSGFVDGSEVSRLHSQIEKISRSRIAPDVTRTGYIVNLDNSGSYSDSHISGMDIRYLNSDLLTESGFTVFTSGDMDLESPTLDKSTDQAEGDLPKGVGAVFELSRNHLETSDDFSQEHEILQGKLSDVRINIDSFPSNSDLEIIIGRDSSGQKITWSKSIAGSPHLVVVGIPGQGKSVLTRRFITSAQCTGLPSLVFDFHGDMMDATSSTVTKIDVAESGLPFSPFSIDSSVPVPVTTASGEIAEILESTFGLGLIQKRNIAEALKQAYIGNGWTDQGQTGRPISMDDFLFSLAQIEEREKNKNASARIQPFTSYQLFRVFDGLEPDFRLTQSLVFDVSRYSKVQEVKLAAGAFILRKIYNDMYSWGMSSEIRVLLVLDEAHLLAKNPTIPKLMKEGRKYGIALMIVSQSIDDFSPEVPENAGTKIAFRTNFPSSKKVASMLRSRGSADLGEAIENLRVGEAYVSSQGKSEPQLLLPSD